MRFTDKYELLESLTTGPVETFVANDKVRGESVLVHIVEGVAQTAGQSTMEWVLESFRRVAPEPAGPVLETGKYAEAKYVYLVVKPADEAAQNSWVRRYEIQGLDTQETRTRPKTADVIAPPVTPTPARESERAPVSVTQLLRDFDSQIKTPAKPKESAPPPLPLPNLTLGGNQSGLHSPPPWEPVRPQGLVAPKHEEPRVPHPVDSFSRDAKDIGFPSASFPVTSTNSVVKDSPKPGEFTSFFQGPFRGDAASDMPVVTSQPIEPPRKTVGDFTAVFGSVGSRQAPSTSLEESGNIAPSTFTGIFRDIDTPPRGVNATAPPSAVTPAPLDPLPVAKAIEAAPTPVCAAPGPPVIPIKVATLPPLPSPGVEKQPIGKPGSLSGDGATGAFSRPAANDPAPVMPAVPVGPSPYTQIISREKLMASSADAAEEESGQSAVSGKFALPAAPKAPAPPKQPQMKMPAPPKIAPPAVPKAPKMPKVEVPAPPAVSMMPLVITLTGLFFLAVLLVLYFVLKH
jgi:hypothetical protein